MLIGICGKAGAGKDTIGDYLISKHSYKKIALADPIKRLVEDVFVLDKETVYDRVKREQPLEQWDGRSVRELLQFIGTELFRSQIDDAIWVKSLWFRIKRYVEDSFGDYVVTDIRFPNEKNFLKKNAKKNFKLIKVVRKGYKGQVGIKGHKSESYDLDADYVVQNNGSKEQLYKKIDKILKELK